MQDSVVDSIPAGSILLTLSLTDGQLIICSLSIPFGWLIGVQVELIYSTDAAFAAVKSDATVVAWGDPDRYHPPEGGASSTNPPTHINSPA